jgi:hypothetical protein
VLIRSLCAQSCGLLQGHVTGIGSLVAPIFVLNFLCISLFTLGIPFYSEDGGIRFLRNVCKFLPDCMVAALIYSTLTWFPGLPSVLLFSLPAPKMTNILWPCKLWLQTSRKYFVFPLRVYCVYSNLWRVAVAAVPFVLLLAGGRNYRSYRIGCFNTAPWLCLGFV